MSPSSLQIVEAGALLRAWAIGVPLSAGDREKIGAVLPSAAQLSGRLTRELYQHKLPHYESTFQADTRTLKRWIAKGRAASPPDYPPLDSPGEIAVWWDRNMSQRCPQKLLDLATPAQGAGPASASAPTSAAAAAPPSKTPAADFKIPTLDPKPAEERGPSIELVMGADIASDLGLQQAQALVTTTFGQLKEALANGERSRARELRREWREYVQVLRAWEKDIGEIMEKRGDMLRTSVVSSELVRILTMISQTFTGGMLSLAEMLAPELPPEARRAKVLPLRDACFQHLRASRWQGLMPAGGPAPPPPPAPVPESLVLSAA